MEVWSSCVWYYFCLLFYDPILNTASAKASNFFEGAVGLNFGPTSLFFVLIYFNKGSRIQTHRSQDPNSHPSTRSTDVLVLKLTSI